MKIKAIIWQEDGVWCGSVPALPGCHTWGESYEQLLEMLEDAVQGWLEVASQQNELAPDKQLEVLLRILGLPRKNCNSSFKFNMIVSFL